MKNFMNKFFVKAEKKLKVLLILFLTLLLLLVSFTFLNAGNGRTVKVLKTLDDTFHVVGNLIVDGNVTVKGTTTGAGFVPSGMIAMFDTSCPVGWTRFTALDNRFPLGASASGNTGGSNQYRVGTLNNQYQCCKSDAGSHGVYFEWKGESSASIQGTTDDWQWVYSSYKTHWPPYYSMVFCKKN
ncbi:MAG: hypothetical protein C0412_18730 [Flavobacterium sp.]|nr:hypothetical protein [Flavobacterium sp.]